MSPIYMQILLNISSFCAVCVCVCVGGAIVASLSKIWKYIETLAHIFIEYYLNYFTFEYFSVEHTHTHIHILRTRQRVRVLPSISFNTILLFEAITRAGQNEYAPNNLFSPLKPLFCNKYSGNFVYGLVRALCSIIYNNSPIFVYNWMKLIDNLAWN